jgi:hypothetical protein
MAVQPFGNTSAIIGQFTGVLVVILGWWGWRKRRKWALVLAVFVFALSLVFSWVNLFDDVRRQPVWSYATIYPLVIIAFMIVILIFGEFHRLWSPLVVVFIFDQILWEFSDLYWNVGGGHNFTSPLSHLDSLYFSLGTLTTAGTGNIAAASEAARRIQTIQMLLDLSLVVFAISIVVVRASIYFTNRKSSEA